MLSRVANRIYWLSRYMERSENTARLVNVYSGLLLDIPKNEKIGWHTILKIIGADEDFEQRYPDFSESNVIYYLLADTENSGSLASSVKFARENARTTRDTLPSEVWNTVNDAYLKTRHDSTNITARNIRFKYLTYIINCGERFEGIISSGMSRNDTYRFFILGTMIERADMLTRVLDTGALLLNQDKKNFKAYEGIVWMNLLKSISAYQMYRQSVKRRVDGEEVIKFLVLSDEFPRSVWYCAETISKFAKNLPNHKDVGEAVQHLKKYLKGFNFDTMNEGNVHKFMDEIQKKLHTVGAEIDSAWFTTEHD